MWALRDKNTTLPDAKDVVDEIQMLLSVIETCNKTENRRKWQDEDWIHLANETLPAAFSKLFHSEEVNATAQNFFRETKLMDAIFEVTTAPYIREYPNKPFRWAESWRAHG